MCKPPKMVTLAGCLALAMLGGVLPFVLLALGLDVLVLYLTLGFRQFSHYFTDIRDALERGDDATARQRRDGMCWKDAAETYNNGAAFKLTARDASGVIVTLISDNYFGYCKKEVKTHLSYAANLLGRAEEEHAGGALAFPRNNHGEEFGVDSRTRPEGYSFADMVALKGKSDIGDQINKKIVRPLEEANRLRIKADFNDDALLGQGKDFFERRALGLRPFGLGLHQDRVHPHVRGDARRERLQPLRDADLAAVAAME